MASNGLVDEITEQATFSNGLIDLDGRHPGVAFNQHIHDPWQQLGWYTPAGVPGEGDDLYKLSCSNNYGNLKCGQWMIDVHMNTLMSCGTYVVIGDPKLGPVGPESVIPICQGATFNIVPLCKLR